MRSQVTSAALDGGCAAKGRKRGGRGSSPALELIIGKVASEDLQRPLSRDIQFSDILLSA